MDDLIRKQDAIDAIQDEISKESHRPHQITLLHAKRRIENLLPAQQWIPCSEGLPEDNQFVLMTIRRMDKHYNHKPFISVGYILWNQSLWWCAHDGDCEPNDVRVDAWMPLPEPYKEGIG